MKTIAVLTDFSERSANAGRYALQLARHLQANILLYHTFLVPSAEPMGAQIAWPMEESHEIKKNSEQQLRQQAGLLNEELAGLTADDFRPAITCSCSEGAFTLNLDGLTADKDLILLVMTNHHKGFSTLMMGNHLMATLDTTSLPVLVVPEHAVFRNIQKIAFPTDLRASDLEVLNSLVAMARPFHAAIMLAHIHPAAKDRAAEVKGFLQDVGNRIDYPHIYYRDVSGMQVNTGLQELEKKVFADLLVVVHRNKSFIEQLFGGSYTLKIAADPLLPLLVYPYPARSYPVF